MGEGDIQDDWELPAGQAWGSGNPCSSGMGSLFHRASGKTHLGGPQGWRVSGPSPLTCTSELRVPVQPTLCSV